MKKKWISLLLILSMLLCGCTEMHPIADTAPALPSVSGEGLTVHFMDVGQADCALLECGGEYMLIDGGNRDDGQLVVSYLEQQGVEELSYVVCTHAHEDHVGGLPAVLAVYPTEAVYAPTRTYSSNIFDDFVYYTDQQGLEITIPGVSETFSLGEAEITVLGPVKSYAETNDTSIVLRVDYGSNSFLFTGDMEIAAENDMLDHWGDDSSIFHADVLKVGHHCSNTSTGYRFLYAVDPEYGIISCGRDNSYGHPHEEPLSRLKDAGVALFRTDELGHIVAFADGEEITFTWGNQSAQPEDVEPAKPPVFIGNKNSKTLHSEDCGSLPNPENRVTFDSYEDAVSQGYKPHSNCLG